MTRPIASRPIVVLLLGVTCLAGCRSARYVRKDADCGIVAIPSNTNGWPMHYRDEAEELMAAHFPDGYAIDREEEVVVGTTTTYNQQKDHRSVQNEKGTAELNVFGTHGSVTSQDKTEWRIYYRRR